MWVSVPNPDDQLNVDVPIYEGDDSYAHTSLIDGVYAATDESGHPVRLFVQSGSSQALVKD